MDVSSIIYKELFNIKFDHPAYSLANGSEVFNHLTVVPDKATSTLFNRFNMGYRCVNDAVICFIRCSLVSPPAKEPKTPFVVLEPVFKIRFLLKASTAFFSKTYVAATGSKVVYYFTNQVNNVENTSRFINKAVEPYNISNSYDAGTIVSSSGENFATLQPVNSADNIAISNASFWKKVLPVQQVANNADLQNAVVVNPDTECFGVIDIFNNGTTNVSYNLFDAGQQLLSPVYTIPFKSKI